MRSRWNLPAFAIYAAASLAVLVYLFAHMGGAFTFQHTYNLAADFSTASNLVPGDSVTVSGMTVGRVSSVQPVQGGARVNLQLNEKYAPMYHDARAMIKVKNLLNESYVELYRGTASSGQLPQGGTIPRSRTLTPVEVAQVLDVLNPDTRTQLASLINNLGESVSGRGQDLNDQVGTLKTTAQSLDGISHSLASQQVNLGSLISSLSKVLATLAAYHSQLRGLVANWNGVMQALDRHEQELQGLIVNENQVMAILDQAFAHNAANLHTAIQEAPQLVNGANAYATHGHVVFSKVDAQLKSVNELFYELASVFSATDTKGNHYWRVYPVSGGFGTLTQPLIPSGGTKGHGGTTGKGGPANGGTKKGKS